MSWLGSGYWPEILRRLPGRTHDWLSFVQFLSRSGAFEQLQQGEVKPADTMSDPDQYTESARTLVALTEGAMSGRRLIQVAVLAIAGVVSMSATEAKAEDWGRYYHWPYHSYHQYQWSPYEYQRT